MTELREYPSQHIDFSVTVANGQTKSSAFQMYGCSIVGILVPSTFDGSQITFEASNAIDGTFGPVKDTGGTSYTITCTAGDRIGNLDAAMFIAFRFWKIVCGTSQTGDTVFTVLATPL